MSPVVKAHKTSDTHKASKLLDSKRTESYFPEQGFTFPKPRRTLPFVFRRGRRHPSNRPNTRSFSRSAFEITNPPAVNSAIP